MSNIIPRFSDRDLFMQYHGGGVGHLATRQCNRTLLADKHTELTDEHIFMTVELLRIRIMKAKVGT